MIIRYPILSTIMLCFALTAGAASGKTDTKPPAPDEQQTAADADANVQTGPVPPSAPPLISKDILLTDDPVLPNSSELAATGPSIVQPASERAERYIRSARIAARSRDFERAEELYSQPVQLDIPEPLKQTALLELAAMYENSNMLTKMAIVLEKFVKQWPRDPRVPQIYMRLGHIYRDLGSNEVAITRFYKVLSVSLNIPEDQLSDYRSLSLRAQFDIAQTYFTNGDYDEAAKFYDRLVLLELSPTDREHVMFKTSYIHHIRGDYQKAISRIQQFMQEHPHSSLVPEALFLLAHAHRELGHHKKALITVLTLLKTQQSNTKEDRDTWRYWQKKSANLVANDFYERGDYHAALQIYQAMARLSSEPAWQMPVIYQMGLCFERLRLIPKAREAYRILSELDEWDKASVEGDKTLASIQQMAQWRLEHLDWSDRISSDVAELQRDVFRDSSKQGTNATSDDSTGKQLATQDR